MGNSFHEGEPRPKAPQPQEVSPYMQRKFRKFVATESRYHSSLFPDLSIPPRVAPKQLAVVGNIYGNTNGILRDYYYIRPGTRKSDFVMSRTLDLHKNPETEEWYSFQLVHWGEPNTRPGRLPYYRDQVEIVQYGGDGLVSMTADFSDIYFRFEKNKDKVYKVGFGDWSKDIHLAYYDSSSSGKIPLTQRSGNREVTLDFDQDQGLVSYTEGNTSLIEIAFNTKLDIPTLLKKIIGPEIHENPLNPDLSLDRAWKNVDLLAALGVTIDFTKAYMEQPITRPLQPIVDSWGII